MCHPYTNDCHQLSSQLHNEDSNAERNITINVEQQNVDKEKEQQNGLENIEGENQKGVRFTHSNFTVPTFM